VHVSGLGAVNSGAPAQRPFAIERPRVLARLEDAARFPITIVSAPAGAGKSVGVSQYLERLPGGVVHFHDAIPFDDQLVDLDRSHSEGAVTVVVEHADGLLARESTHGALARNVLQFPGRRWILICRDASTLPVASWVSGRIAGEPVSIEDLQLTVDEAARIAREHSIGRDAASRLFECAQALPLTFAALCRRPQSASYEDVAHAEWYALPPALADVLEQLVLLPSAAPVEPQLTRIQRDALRQLAAAGVLLGCDAAGNLQLHDAASAVVRKRLATRSQYHLAAVCVRAATLAAQSRRYDWIVALLERCTDTPAAVVFLSQHGFDIIDQGHAASLAPLLSTLIAAHGNHPVLLTLIALCESHAGRDDTADSWFFAAREAAQGTPAQPVVAYRYALEMLRRQHPEAANELAVYVDDETIAPQLRASIESALAIAHVLGKRFEEARLGIARALHLVEHCCDRETRVRTLQSAAWVAFFTGDIATARSYAPVAAADAMKLGLYDVAARALSVEYNIAYDLDDDPRRSTAILEDIYACGVRSRRGQLVVYALLGQLDLAGERGDAAEIARIEATLNAWEFDYSDTFASESLIPVKALMAAGVGRYSTAYELLTSTGERLFGDDRRLWRHSEIALYAAACGLPGPARAALDAMNDLKDEPESRRAAWAKANAILARAMLGDDAGDLIRALDRSIRSHDFGRRVAAYAAAAGAIISRWNGAANHADVAVALHALDREGLGGYAAMLSALPARYKEAQL